MTLQRHPGSIVSNPRPHQTMAEALGPAVEFWHGVGLTAWFVCEGPYSRTTLARVDRYYSKPLAALRTAGCPVDAAFFRELQAAEQLLGPEEEITDSEDSTVETPYGRMTFTSSMSHGTRREGFERVRDLITRHRHAWAEQHLGAYVKHRWRSELEDVARDHHRSVAAKGRPPTLPQFARFATTAANHWTGGDLEALYTAIGEPAPSQQKRPTRLLTEDGYDFARRVYQGLGGKPVDHDTWMNSPEETQRQWQLSRLATESLRYLQLQEALGRPPTTREFGAQRLTWPWPSQEAEGWPILQDVLATLTGSSTPITGSHSPTNPPPPIEESGTRRLLTKGTNTALRTEPTTVRITATGAPVDVSAVLLSRNGKVRSDHDLVFYNHPSHDGVRVGGNIVTADLDLIPGDIATIAVIVSIDLEAQSAAVFDQHTQWQAVITQSSGTQLTFVPGPFSSGETVTIAVELYRNTVGWKARAVGQGYDTDLAALAADYGINVEA